LDSHARWVRLQFKVLLIVLFFFVRRMDVHNYLLSAFLLKVKLNGNC
jgi:hypothetical protein